MSNVSTIKDTMIELTDNVSKLFNVPLDKAFIAATYILSLEKIPYFKNISEENNKIIEDCFNKFKSTTYVGSEIRRAFSESYLMSLRDIENYTVNVTLELPLIYLVSISDLLVSYMNFSDVNVLNASGNNGNLALALYLSEHINKTNLYVTVNSDDEYSVSNNLKILAHADYTIDKNAPALSYRCDLIVSDPFLRTPEDILIFFEENLEYLNNNGFVVSVLPTQFVRSRLFSDMLEEHSLVLIGLVEYPSDLLEGLISSSIVILEKKVGTNKEFFASQMPSVSNIEENINVINEIKKYIKDYLEGN